MDNIAKIIFFAQKVKKEMEETILPRILVSISRSIYAQFAIISTSYYHACEREFMRISYDFSIYSLISNFSIFPI